MNFAIALIDYNEAALIDPRYVTITAYYLNWLTDANTGTRTSHYSSLPLHTCTSDELGLVKTGREEFFSPRASQAVEVNRLQSHFQCLNDQRLVL